MVPRTLQEDLLRIPGVEGAEVEGSGDQPAGLRIRIAAGADQRAVGAAIRRVLTEHGLGTDTRLPGEDVSTSDEGAGEPVVPETEPGPDIPREPITEAEAATSVAVMEAPEAEVIDLTEDADRETGDLPAVADTVDEAGEAAAEEPLIAEPSVTEPEPDLLPVPALDLDSEPPAPGVVEPVAPPAALEAEGGFARIESVSVEEGRDGILVTVTSSDGETVAQLASSSEGGLDAAIVKATSRLALPEAPDPVIVEIEERRFEGVDIVMVVLDTDGHLTAGSSIVVAGRAFAIGRAAWSALTN